MELAVAQNVATATPEASADLFVGTAGYSYPHWRRGEFYPNGLTQGQELRHYSGVFSAVEINASFHAVPREETLLSWAENSKPGFLFSFKVPQRITHEKRLEHIKSDLDYFLNRLAKMETIRPCLGPILFQLPPSLPKDVSKLDNLSRIIPRSYQVAFEFRNKTWYCPEVYEAMERYGFGLCDNISPDNSTFRVDGIETNAQVGTTAKLWQYIRCHKRANQLVTNYTDEQLSKIAHQLVERRKQKVVQYCFFLNDHDANGPRNAKALMKLIKQQYPNKTRLVQDWKRDPVAPSIKSLFAKSHAVNGSASPSSASNKNNKRPFQHQSVVKTKKTPCPIASFFSPAPKITSSSSQSSSSAKRQKGNLTPQEKKGSIANFFAPKET